MTTRTQTYAAIFAGGAAGSLLRAGLTADIPGLPFTTATFAINVLACLILGWLLARQHQMHPTFVLLAGVGFCGGLSTFSSFVAELDDFRAAGSPYVFVAPAVEIAAGLAAALLGAALAGARRA